MSTHNSSTSTSAATAPVPPTNALLGALATDPVLEWLRREPLPWSDVSRDLMTAAAAAIATALADERHHARIAGRDLFLSCFVKAGARVGTRLCRSVYRSALCEVRAARRKRRVRDLHRLRGSYEQLQHLGVPAAVCEQALRGGDSVADRAEKLAATAAGPVLEETVFNFSEDQFLLDPLNNTWWMRLADGEWVGPMSNAGMMSRLNQLGLPERQAKSFLSRTGHFDTREALFGSDEDVVKRGARAIFNAYRRSSLRPCPGAWPDIYRVIMSVSNGDTGFAEFLLDWLAMPLQSLHGTARSPMKTLTAIVLNGVEGTGKNTLFDIMRVIYGASNCVTLSQNDLDGRFHDQLRDKLFVLCNEVMSSTNRSAETANTLKMYITDPVIPLEGKNKGTVNVPNFFNIMFASNDDSPVIISGNDRRYSVKTGMCKLREDVASRVHSDLNGSQRQVAAFFAFLLRRRVRIKVGEVYDTEDRKQVQLTTAAAEEQFATQIAQDGWISVASAWKDRQQVTPELHYGGFIPSNTLAEVFDYWCRVNGKKKCGWNKLAAALRRRLNPATGSPRIGRDKIKTRGYFGIPLDVESADGGSAKIIPLRSTSPACSDHADFSVEGA